MRNANCVWDQMMAHLSHPWESFFYSFLIEDRDTDSCTEGIASVCRKQTIEVEISPVAL